MDFDLFEMILENSLSLSFATLISEDLAYIYGLFAVQSQHLTSYSFILFFTLGVVLGDLMLYCIGYFFRVFSLERFSPKIQTILDSSNHKVTDSNKFGLFEEFLVFTRFIPGTRLPTYIYCGYSRYSLIKFTLILAITCFLYSILGVLIITLTNYSIKSELNLGLRVLISLSAACISIFSFKILLLIRKIKYKYGVILKPLKIISSRIKHLEFWPSIFIYIPFVPLFLYLYTRYGGIKSLLSSNPAFKMSGLIGEKKSEIDPLLKIHTPLKRLNTIEVTRETSEQTILESGLSFPLILKPDSGMRGAGVRLVKNYHEFVSEINQTDRPFILQEYFDVDNEWGFFYYRFPDTDQGEVYSITIKETPKIIGDGSSSLLDLVFRLPRFSQRFDWIFKESEYSPGYIPKVNEKIKLSLRGSHSKGCLFLDGAEHLNSIAVKDICHNLDKIPGFNVGRVDIKFNNLEELASGLYKIIEINGSGGESTNFYDPKLSKLKVYSILFKQWELIFKIGKENRKILGDPSETLFDLFKEIFNFRKGTKN